MTTLVTGAFGHLGGHVATIAARHDSVILASRRTRQSNLGEVRCADLRDHATLAALVAGVDTIIHLASLNDVDSNRDPVRAHDVNVAGTGALIDAAERAGVRRFVYASTVQVYGDALHGTVTEASPVGESSPYARTHFQAEEVVRASTLEHVCLRLANGFGRPVDPAVNTWRLLVADLCKRAVTDGSLELRTHGRHERDFVPVSDLAAALVHFARLDRLAQPVVIIGSGTPTTLLHMAERIAGRAASFTTRSVRVSINDTDTSAAQRYLLDVSRMRASGFEPALDIDVAIDDLLALAADPFGVRS